MKIQGTYDPSLYRSPFDEASRRADAPLRLTLRSDTLGLSSTGQRLAGKLVIRNDGIATSSKESVNALSDPSMRLMGNAIIEVKEILEKMKTLSEEAQDSALSRDKRIDLQIEMADLQLALYEKAYGMGVNLAKPGEGPMMNADIHEQHARTIAFLGKLRSGGGSVSGGSVRDQAEASGGTVGAVVQFYSTAYELDENGYLKLDESLFNALPDSVRSTLDESLFHAASSSSLPKWASDDDIMKNMSLSLLDTESAVESSKKIEEQLGALKTIEAEFNRLATVDPRVAYEYDGGGRLETGFLTQLGIMGYTSHNGDGTPKDPFDVRLAQTKDPIGKLFAKTDKLFKDGVYAQLGLGTNYQKTEKPKGVNPEQLAIIEALQKKMAEEAAESRTENGEPGLLVAPDITQNKKVHLTRG